MWDANKLELVMEVKKAHEGQRIQCAAVAPDGCLYTGGDDKVTTEHLLSIHVFCERYEAVAILWLLIPVLLAPNKRWDPFYWLPTQDGVAVSYHTTLDP